MINDITIKNAEKALEPISSAIPAPGWPVEDWDISVINSGRDVTAATRTPPINAPPKRVFAIITSAYLINFIDATNKIIARGINKNIAKLPLLVHPEIQFTISLIKK